MTRAKMERRREDAWAMYAMDARPCMVAKACDVSRTTATRWRRAYFAGKSELRTIATGRPRDVDRDAIAELIARGANTCTQLQAAIARVYGRVYNVDHCGRLLHWCAP